VDELGLDSSSRTRETVKIDLHAGPVRDGGFTGVLSGEIIGDATSTVISIAGVKDLSFGKSASFSSSSTPILSRFFRDIA
jgi:hypothetical protein